ncbi:aspartyl-phosphate phosphatase Spo0E family protein [Oceanobacillus halotolerans]|uniref:aspartyl-phosphate phosphatase Spo0E family protein n=1 Tax=Oceanobacillus halotolerans TaxID=2663380 RepID=UPI001CF7A3F3|nr:aspartyl-phosphate phosphatase Spo0E family protein [Oceanobacillus halotolerans]
MRYQTKEEIQSSIHQKRKELFQVANSYGVGSQETLQCSEELDVLIMMYQRLKKTELENYSEMGE